MFNTAGLIIISSILGLAATATAETPAPQEKTNSTVLTFCFAERDARGGPCDFQSAIPAKLGKLETIYVRADEMSAEGMERQFCTSFAARRDDFVLVYLAGKGIESPSGWRMDWVDAQGIARAANQLEAKLLVSKLDLCLRKSPIRKAALLIDGTFFGGSSDHTGGWEDGMGSEGSRFDSVGPVIQAGTRASDLKFTLRMHAEKIAAAQSGGAPDPWNQDVEDLPFLPLSDKADPACRSFWSGMLEQDLVSLLKQMPSKLPSPRTCQAVPEVLQEDHDRYAKHCSKFFAGGSSPASSDEESGCRHTFLYYRASLRHWATRDQDLRQLSDVQLLAEKLIWSSGTFPLGKYHRRQTFNLQLAERLGELRGQSELVAYYRLEAALSLALDAKDRHHPADVQETAWRLAERQADRFLALAPRSGESHRLESAWYAKTWGMEPGRLKKLATSLLKDSTESSRARYLLAYAENFGGSPDLARQMLEALVKSDPTNQDAQTALQQGRWAGLAIATSVQPIDLLQEIGR